MLIQTNIDNLMILPAGRGGPHVPELLSSREMGALLDEMARRFGDRYTIIDTPPCMASSDAAALAPLVGQIVFVVEAYNTQQAEVEAALSVLSACPQISLLLNKSDTQASEHFGSYGYGTIHRVARAMSCGRSILPRPDAADAPSAVAFWPEVVGLAARRHDRCAAQRGANFGGWRAEHGRRRGWLAQFRLAGRRRRDSADLPRRRARNIAAAPG